MLLRMLRGYAFTIAGIAIGVGGLVTLGAMSERIVRFIEGGDRFVLGQISVAGRGMGMGAGFTAGGLLPAATLRALAAVRGVAGVQPQVMLPLNPSVSQFMTLTQELVLGLDLAVPMPNRHYRALPVRAGRFLREGDRRVAVLGASFAAAPEASTVWSSRSLATHCSRASWIGTNTNRSGAVSMRSSTPTTS